MARGSIRPRGTDGRTWEVSVSIPGMDGKRRYDTVHGTKKDAGRRLTELLREMDTGGGDPGSLTVAQYLGRWLSERVDRRLAPQSQAAYRVVTARVCASIGHIRLQRLMPLHIQAMLSKMEDDGLSPNSVRYHRSILCIAMAQAVRWRLLVVNPCDAVEAPKREPKETRALTRHQALELLRVARDSGGVLPIALALGCGLRLGEVRALKWDDVDVSRGALSVTRSRESKGAIKGTKSGRGRVVSLPEFVRLALEAEREMQETIRSEFGEWWNAEGLVCCNDDGGPIYVNQSHHVKKLCEKAGIPVVTFHGLRHTHATLLLAGGDNLKAVSTALGHSSVQITMNVYAHVLPEMRDRLGESANRIFGGDS